MKQATAELCTDAGPGLVLLADDDALFVRALARMLRSSGHRLLTAHSAEQVAEALADPALDAVLLDLQLGADDGMESLALVKRMRPEVEVVVMTGYASIESAVAAMRAGAFDYLEKPLPTPEAVRESVRRALARRRGAAPISPRALAERGAKQRLVGSAPRMRAVLRMIESLRDNESSVLILGESGTGKELAAQAIHAVSQRHAGPFVPVDCGALPESIIESELFGHERGAFTGATGAAGLFRVAHGGTLFLDEVGELPLTAQAKLLRALQQREVRPVGAANSVAVDIRVICATNRDLAEMVGQGSFRKDLFYRLNVVRLELPSLRERREDIPALVQHFFAKHGRADAGPAAIEPDALLALSRHAWPGNVRELENAIESALALTGGERLRAQDLAFARPAAMREAPPAELPLSLDAYERCAIERALQECRGDATAAARRLGIGRSTFYRKLAKHGIGASGATRSPEESRETSSIR